MTNRLIKIVFVSAVLNLGGYELSLAQQNILVDPDIRIGQLSNGFSYFIKNKKNTDSSIYISMPMKVGSILEEEKELGLAHFLEHMAFNGTTSYPGKSMINYLEKEGVGFGSMFKAHTGTDATIYEITIPNNRDRLFENSLRILRDISQHITLDSGEVEAERGVVISEIRMFTSNFRSRLEGFYKPSLMNFSKYAFRNPLGTVKSIETFKYADLLEFYKKWYHPNRQAVIVIGEVDVAKTEQMIIDLFSSQHCYSQNNSTVKQISLSNESNVFVLTDPEVEAISIETYIKLLPPGFQNTDDFYDFAFFKSIYSEIISKRIRQHLVSDMPPFKNAASDFTQLSKELLSVRSIISVSPSQIESGIKTIMSEIGRFLTDDIASEELNSAKERLLMKISNKSFYDNDPSYGLFDYYIYGTPALSNIVVESKLRYFLNKLTPLKLKFFFKSYVGIKNIDVVIIAPESVKSEISSKSEILKWVENSIRNPVTAGIYKDKEILSDTQIKQLGEGNVFCLNYDSLTSLYDVLLTNGIRVVVKPTSSGTDDLMISWQLTGRKMFEKCVDTTSLNQFYNIWELIGMGQLNRKEVQYYFSNHTLEIEPLFSNSKFAFKFKGSSGIADKMFQVIYSLFVNKYLDNAALNSLLNSDDQIQASELKKSFSVFSELLDNSGDFVFLITGNFDKNEIMKLASKFIGNLNGFKNHSNYSSAVVIDKADTVFDGTANTARIRLKYQSEYIYNDYNNLNIDLLSALITKKLIERLREKESGVYVPFVSVAKQKYPIQKYSIDIYFDCDPEATDRLVKAAIQEMDSIKFARDNTPVLGSLIDNEKKTLDTQLKTPDIKFWFEYLNNQIAAEDCFQAIINRKLCLDAINSNTISDSAKFYFDTSKLHLQITLPRNGRLLE